MSWSCNPTIHAIPAVPHTLLCQTGRITRNGHAHVYAKNAVVVCWLRLPKPNPQSTCSPVVPHRFPMVATAC